MNINNSNLAELNKTKKKITLLFTWSVLFIIILLWLTFFSVKLQLVRSFEYNTLNQLLSITQQIIDEEWINNIWFNKIFRKFRPPIRWNLSSPNQYINLIVIDNFAWEIFLEHLQDWVDKNMFLRSILHNKKYDWETLQIWNEKYLISSSSIKSIFAIHDLTLYAFLWSSYTLNNYSKELLSYFWATLILAFLLYFISLKLVSFSIKPVEDSLKDMEQFIHNAWHELKNPIASIYSCIQLIQKNKDNKEYIENSISEIKKIDNLINSLISLTYFSPYKNTWIINLDQEVKRITKENEIKLKSKNIDLTIKIEPELNIECNNEYFYILFSNILFNAIKFSKEFWTIKIFNKWQCLHIEDKWIWINKENINKVFGRFFKEDSSRSTEGFWIWLSLVKRISEIYWWKISIHSAKGQWTTFKIDFK